LIIGGSGPNNTETTPAVLNSVLDTKFRIVTGYASSTATALAVERGEVEGLCTAYNTIATRNPDWLRDKKVNILVQAALRKNPKIPDVPLAIDLAKTPEDRAVLELNDSRLEIGRPFVAPPNLPAERLKLLRDAFEATLLDQGFVDELAKEKLDLTPIEGLDAQALLERVSKTPKPLIDRLNAALAYKADATAPAH
jgi:hypothetical protein